MTTCANAQVTLTVTIVDAQKIIHISLQNVQEYKNFGHTINQYSPNLQEIPIPHKNIY